MESKSKAEKTKAKQLQRKAKQPQSRARQAKSEARQRKANQYKAAQGNTAVQRKAKQSKGKQRNAKQTQRKSIANQKSAQRRATQPQRQSKAKQGPAKNNARRHAAQSNLLRNTLGTLHSPPPPPPLLHTVYSCLIPWPAASCTKISVMIPKEALTLSTKRVSINGSIRIYLEAYLLPYRLQVFPFSPFRSTATLRWLALEPPTKDKAALWRLSPLD